MRESDETVRQLDALLAHDPAAIYARMDAATRADYREAVRRLAHRAGLATADVAQRVVAQARAAADPQRRHVGDVLFDHAAPPWARAAGGGRLHRAVRRGAFALYALLVVATTIVLAALVLGAVPALPAVAGWMALLVVAIAASHAATALVNAAALLVQPRRLPRLDFGAGVPADAATLVVVPALLASHAGVERLVATLRRHHSRNRDAHVAFALLTDYVDAATQHCAGDDALLEQAQRAIDAANRELGGGFVLLHRPRRYDAGEGGWIGHERKRGKLVDLVELLATGRRDAFTHIGGDVRQLDGRRFVVTLDADSELPQGTVRALASLLAHPANALRCDASGHPVSGYTFIEPLADFVVPHTGVTGYARLASLPRPPGLLADTWQDLFGEGSFHGKGIFAVDAFHRLLGGAFPDDQVLSHDILEGCLARSALAADLRLPELVPATFLADMERLHRWVRGDWQSLPWLLPWMRTRDGRWRRNRPGALGRWKLADNARRTMIDAAFALALPLLWWYAPQPGLATMGLLAVFALPTVLGLLLQLRGALAARGAPDTARTTAPSAAAVVQLALLHLATIPHRAWVGVDAAARALWRTLVSRRRLLQWRASDLAPDHVGASLRVHLRAMAPSLLFVVALAALFVALRPAALPAALPLLVLWLLAPVLVRALDQPLRVARESVGASS